jgi:hypothetical protein
LRGALLLTLALTGCAVSPRVQVLAALTPIDATRPYYVYAPAEGNACGEGAEQRAIDDLLRLSPVDGFVAVVISQEVKKGGCVTVTARPITYGCEPKTFGPAATAQPHLVQPGPATCPAGASTAGGDTCTQDCTAYAGKLGGSEFETSAFKNRCLFRCKGNDAPFMACARAAVAAADVKACDAK